MSIGMSESIIVVEEDYDIIITPFLSVVHAQAYLPEKNKTVFATETIETFGPFGSNSREEAIEALKGRIKEMATATRK